MVVNIHFMNVFLILMNAREINIISPSFLKHDEDPYTICKSDCGDKFYTIIEPNTCLINGCIESYPLVSENNIKLCLKECQFDKFIIVENDRKIFVSNCKEYISGKSLIS